MSSKAAVVGVDLGSSTSFVGYVGKGVVDLVQNEVSQRATSTIIGFTDRERLLGDAALAQIRSNSKNSCRNFKHLLGRNVDAPDVQQEHFWSTAKLATAEDSYAGYDVSYKGEPRVMSASQCTAMFLTQLKHITEKWCQAKLADAVISVPSFFSDTQRQALLDAAKIAGIPVLRLMNEHTATALSYGIYRSNDFDPEKPMTVVFCSMGHSIFSVSIVQFIKGKLTILCERSDKVGGRDMDECLMRAFGEQFQKKTGCDPLSNKKAAFKLEDAVSKCKKTLSANAEAPVSVECLMEEEDFASAMNRSIFEKMCEPMMGRVQAVLDAAKQAAGFSDDQIDSVEVVGGASRVPWVKKMCSDAFGGKDLSTTMNADECVARGCALQAAILSPLYKVRDFTVVDTSPLGYNIGWMGSSTDAEVQKDGDGDAPIGGADGEYKTVTVFPAGSQMGSLKQLTFNRQGPFDIKAEYTPDSVLPPMTATDLGTYRIELPPQSEPKKIEVRMRLTLNGVFTIEGAQMKEIEEYEEKSKEKRELPADAAPATEAPPADAAAADADVTTRSPSPEPAEPSPVPSDGETEAKPEGADAGDKKKEAEKPKEPEKKYEWVEVTKMKKRTKKTDLVINVNGKPGIADRKLQSLTDAETAMQADMREIIETDERKNDLESYIFNFRDKTGESGDYGVYISAAEREQFHKDLTSAEDWLYDTYDATKVQYVEKLDSLKQIGSVVEWRCREDGMREEWIQAVIGTAANYRTASENPGEKYGHIAPEKLVKITEACSELDKWLADLRARQTTVMKHEKPVLICADMEKKNDELAKMADEILKEPKPAPPKEPEAEAKKEGEGAEKQEAASEEQKAASPESTGDANNVD